MPLELGAAFPPLVCQEEVEVLRPLDIEDLRAEQLLSALERLHEALAAMPAPVVNVAEPDLTAIVQAVTQLNGPATPEEIAAAIKAEIAPHPQPEIEPTLKKLTEALEKLDFRMKGMGSGGGGGGVGSRVQNVDGTALETREAGSDNRFEWQAVGGQSVPRYIGRADPGTQTSASTWRIDRYDYITGPAGDAVPSEVRSVTGAWDNRASLF